MVMVLGCVAAINAQQYVNVKRTCPQCMGYGLLLIMNDKDIRNNISRTNPFMFDLYRLCKGDKSIVMSPVSIMLLVSMVANGASGETQGEILKALGTRELSIQELNGICKILMEELPLRINNSIGVNNELKMSDEYVRIIHDVYQATINRDSDIDWVTLTNSVQFCGTWLNTFNDKYTITEPFYKKWLHGEC